MDVQEEALPEAGAEDMAPDDLEAAIAAELGGKRSDGRWGEATASASPRNFPARLKGWLRGAPFRPVLNSLPALLLTTRAPMPR
jgi:hypothetical protein